MMAPVCVCGHSRDLHRHHTRPSDTTCALCDCDQWRRRWTSQTGWRAWRRYQRLVASGGRDLRRR